MNDTLFLVDCELSTGGRDLLHVYRDRQRALQALLLYERWEPRMTVAVREVPAGDLTPEQAELLARQDAWDVCDDVVFATYYTYPDGAEETILADVARDEELAHQAGGIFMMGPDVDSDDRGGEYIIHRKRVRDLNAVETYRLTRDDEFEAMAMEPPGPPSPATKAAWEKFKREVIDPDIERWLREGPPKPRRQC